MPEAYPFYLAGRAVVPSKHMTVTDKYTGKIAENVGQADLSAIEKAIAAAALAAEPMRAMPAYQRQAILQHVTNRIQQRSQHFANVMCIEAGKPIRDARTEVIRAIDTFRLAAEESTRIHGEYLPLDISARSVGFQAITKRFPIGPCSFITPFNFPLNLVAHKVAPAIAMGCPFVLKPAPTTPITAILLGEILAETDLPEGAFSILPCEVEDAAPLVEDERIKLLSFTGSAAVGWSLKSKAGKKKIVLELGGNAACIVDRDANLDYAAERILFGAFYQSGQSCISVQRLIVHEEVYDELKHRLVRGAQQLKAGDPRDESTILGPLISMNDVLRIDKWVQEGAARGAKVLCGGRRPSHLDGVFYEATIVENVPRDTMLASEEVFGPVMTIVPFSDFDEACAIANQSRYGLQAGVFTNSLHNALRAFDALEVGGVIINDVPSIRVDSMPYGGVKDSGLGREGVRYAMMEMSEMRLLAVNNRVSGA